MSVMRVHKTNNFTVMSNYHFKEKGMSLKAIPGLKNVFSPKHEERKGVNDVLEEHGRILFAD